MYKQLLHDDEATRTLYGFWQHDVPPRVPGAAATANSALFSGEYLQMSQKNRNFARKYII